MQHPEFSMQTIKDKFHDICLLLAHQIGRLKDILSAEVIDPNAVSIISEKDDEIDQLENTISQLVVEYLALKQPLASELRYLLSVLRSIVVIERQGDLIYQVAKKMRKSPQIESNPAMKQSKQGIMEVVDILSQQISGQHKLVEKGDQNLAQQIIEHDLAVNKTTKLFQNKLLEANLPPLNLILLHEIFNDLERIGDYAKKISKFYLFFLTGKELRHKFQTDQ